MAVQEIFLPGLQKLVDALFSGNQDSRIEQSLNAPQIMAENQGTLTDAAYVKITEAQNQGTKYSYLLVMFSEAAGKGRWSCNGKATATGNGFPITSGGGTITIPGISNIRNFAMIAETGQTLPYTYALLL